MVLGGLESAANLEGSALSLTAIPNDNRVDKIHNTVNGSIQRVIGQFDEIGPLGCSLYADWPIRVTVQLYRNQQAMRILESTV